MMIDVYKDDAIKAYFYGRMSELIRNEDKFKAYLMMTEFSGTEPKQDGFSDIDIYVQSAGIDKKEFYSYAKGMLVN